MARIRSIKPELRTDLDVAAWPIPARYAWALLWGYLDDSGRGYDDDRLLVADLFPLDRDVTERKFAGWKKLWVDGGQVCRFKVAGTSYLHVLNWDQHQRINRPTGSRIPPCPEHGPSKYDSLSDSVSPSLNGSLSDSLNGSSQTRGVLTEGSRPRAQAGAPAEQGAGSREKEGSSEQGVREPRRPRDGGTLTDTLLEEHRTKRPTPDAVATRLRTAIDDSLKTGTETQVRQALAEWRRRPGAKPGLLPHLVADVIAAHDAPDPMALDADAAAYVAELQAERAAKDAIKAGAR